MVYIFVLIILLVGLNYDKSSNTRGAKTWWRFEWLVLVLLAALRYRVGGDTLSYQDTYDYLPNLNELLLSSFAYLPNQPLWYVFCGLCKLASEEFWFFQIVHAIILNAVIFWYIKRYSHRPFLSILFYAIMLYTYYNMEILKQSLTLCCFLLSYPYLEQRKFLRYYMLATLGFLFHTVGALLFLLPPLYWYIYNKGERGTLIYVLITFLGISIVSEFTSLGNELNNLGMTAISGKMISYSRTGEVNLYNGFMGILYVIIVRLIPLFLFLKYNKFDSKSSYAITTIYFILQGLGVSLIFMHRVVELLNIPFYVILVNSIDTQLIQKGTNTSAYDYYDIQKSQNAKLAVMLLLVVICYVKYSYYTLDRTSFNNGAPARFYHLYTPYYSIFDPQIDQRRENVYWGHFNN